MRASAHIRPSLCVFPNLLLSILVAEPKYVNTPSASSAGCLESNWLNWERRELESVGLLPGAEVELEGEQRVSVQQALVEDIKIGFPDSLQIVL